MQIENRMKTLETETGQKMQIKLIHASSLY